MKSTVIPMNQKRPGNRADHFLMESLTLRHEPTLDLQRIRARFMRLPVKVRESPVTLAHLVAFVEEILDAVNRVTTEIKSLNHPPGGHQQPHKEIEPGPTVTFTGK